MNNFLFFTLPSFLKLSFRNIMIIISIALTKPSQFPLLISNNASTTGTKFKDLFYQINYPTFGTINNRVCSAPGTKNWKTPAGFFRQLPTDNPTPCPPGFWCPSNVFEPVYCCPGFYCPTPATIYICPKDMYCPMG